MIIWKYFFIGLILFLVSLLFVYLGYRKGQKRLLANPDATTRGKKFLVLLTQGAVELWIFASLAMFLSTLFIGGAFRWW